MPNLKIAVFINTSSSSCTLLDCQGNSIFDSFLLGNALQLCAIKAPGFGENRRANLDDLAVFTGGEVIKVEMPEVLCKYFVCMTEQIFTGYI